MEKQIRDLVAQAITEVLGPSEPSSPPLSAPSAAPGKSLQAPAKTVAIGADHGGYPLKEELMDYLRQRGYAVTDCGTQSKEACDYPDFAHEVARRVAGGFCRDGILIDGAGIGSAMVANKVPGVRAAVGYDLSSARNSREHNHANVLTLGAGLIGGALARQIVVEWLETPWGPGRHARRVEMITAVERRYTGAEGRKKEGA